MAGTVNFNRQIIRRSNDSAVQGGSVQHHTTHAYTPSSSSLQGLRKRAPSLSSFERKQQPLVQNAFGPRQTPAATQQPALQIDSACAKLYKDTQFSSMKIEQYVMNKFGQVNREKLIQSVLEAVKELEPDLKKQAINKQKVLDCIDEILGFSVRAGSGVMPMVVTDEGLMFIGAKSQRRGWSLIGGGVVEKNESFEDAAKREFVEELGSLSQVPIMSSLFKTPVCDVCFSDTIGTTPKEFSKNILKVVDDSQKTLKFFIYASAITVLPTKQSLKEVTQALQKASEPLQAANDSNGNHVYDVLGRALFGRANEHGPANLSDPAIIEKLAQTVEHFLTHDSALLPKHLKESIFDQTSLDELKKDPTKFREACLAIVDVTENIEFRAIPVAEVMAELQACKTDYLAHYKPSKTFFNDDLSRLQQHLVADPHLFEKLQKMVLN